MTDEPPDQRSTAEVAMALVSALGRRADRVDVEPTPQARQAVDRRRRRRARRRQVRRGLAAAAAVVVAIGGAGAVVRLVDRESDPAVVAGGGAPGPAWCDEVLRPGQAGDDPALLGLPRLVFGDSAGLTPTVSADPLVTVTPDDDPGSQATVQVQEFRPPDQALPVIVAPWSPAGAQLDQPVPGVGNERVEVGGIPAALAGSPPGWTTLAWPMTDGTKAYVSAYGVSRGTLLAFAEGLSRPDPSTPGYVAGYLPPGFEGTVRDVGGRSDDAGYVAVYRYSTRSADVDVVVEVWTEPVPSQMSPLEAVLSEADAAESIAVLDQPGILADYGSGRWLVAWSAGYCLANLRIEGADRAEVDELVAALRIANDREWADLLREGRS